jgi:hypothetical protein
MRFTEFKSSLHAFVGTVRIPIGARHTTIKLVLFCDGYHQAKALFAHLFGPQNIVSLSQTINESEASKVQSPEELQVKAMSDQAKQLQLQAKTARAKKSLDRAKQSLQKATSGRP